MFGRELLLPDTLISGVPASEKLGQSEYAKDLQERFCRAYDKLRAQQNVVRNQDTQEPPLYRKGEMVLLKNQRQKKGTSSKLRRKFVGPYKIQEVFDNHTYTIERNGKLHREHEGRLKPFYHARQAWGRATGENEANRQPTRAGYPVPCRAI